MTKISSFIQYSAFVSDETYLHELHAIFFYNTLFIVGVHIKKFAQAQRLQLAVSRQILQPCSQPCRGFLPKTLGGAELQAVSSGTMEGWRVSTLQLPSSWAAAAAQTRLFIYSSQRSAGIVCGSKALL